MPAPNKIPDATDVVVIGAGAAGLAAPEPAGGRRVGCCGGFVFGGHNTYWVYFG